MAHVLPARGGIEARLSGRGLHPPQRVDDRRSQMTRQVARLVEPSPKSTPWMQGHWNNTVRIPQDLDTGDAHEAGKRLTQCAETLVLERMQDVTKNTVVWPGRSRDGEDWRVAAAGRAVHRMRTELSP